VTPLVYFDLQWADRLVCEWGRLPRVSSDGVGVEVVKVLKRVARINGHREKRGCICG